MNTRHEHKLRPAFDQINGAAARRGLNPRNAEYTWDETGGNSVTFWAVFPDGTTLSGYAPEGKLHFRESVQFAREEGNSHLQLVMC